MALKNIVSEIFFDNIFAMAKIFRIGHDPNIFTVWTPNKTSLLRRLQEQTLPDEAPPMGKIYPFSKIAVTFEPVM